MTQEFEETLDWAGGYFPNQAVIGKNSRIKNSLMPGSKNVWIEGPSKFTSWDGPAPFANFGNNTTHIVGGLLGTLRTGSVIQFLDRRYWAIGSGNVNVGDGTSVTALGSLTGKENILHYFAIIFGTQIGQPTAALLRAGISKPVGVPLISPAADKTNGRTSGLISLRVSYVSPVTESESNASDPSVPVMFDGDNVQVVLPPTPPEVLQGGGTPLIRLYSSFRGFGAFGPWFYVGNSERPLTSPFTTTWTDGDLLRILAPIDNDPPRSATHCFSLGDILVLAGEGGRLQASKPGLPEAYPPDFETSLDPQEDVLAIRGRPEDGWQYVCCRNSIHAVSLNEDDARPIIPRAIFGQVGIANKNAATQVSGQLYGYSAKKHAFRTSGSKDPDVEFALPVESDMADWDPNKVVVGYHQTEDCVVYFHKKIALVYKRKLDQWCAPFVIDTESNTTGEEVASCETIAGQLVFSVGTADGGQIQYVFSGGNNPNIPWRAIPFWREGDGGQGYDKTIDAYIFSYGIGAGKQIEAILRGDFDLNKIRATSGLLSGSAKALYSPWIRPNITDIKAFTVEFRGQGGGQTVQDCVVLGGVCNMQV